MERAFPNLSKKGLSFGVVEKYLFALVLYIIFSVFLFWSHFEQLKGYQLLYLINPVAAASGAYFLSRRWVCNWTPSLVAGAVYGFSAFSLSFGGSHQPIPGLSFVMVPWLLLPSVYWHKNKPPDALRFTVRTIFVLLPFAAICLMFWAAAQKWVGPHFLMPATARLTPQHFLDLIFPLMQKGEYLTFGLYHGAIILSLMGLFVLVKAQRIALLIPVAVALVLCFWEPILQVSPIVWAAFPILFLAILTGLGFQSLLWAGKSDSRWIIACAIAASILAAFFGGLAYKRLIIGGLLEWTALMYAVAAAALWFLFFLAKTGLRWHPMRWMLLTAAVTIDLIYSARYLVEKLF